MTSPGVSPPNRIRVMRVIARMNVGGPALQVTGLLAGMNPDRFDHRLLTGYVEEGEADFLDLRAPQFRVCRVAGLGRSPSPAGDMRALATLVRAMRRFRPHVVHTHTAKAGALGRTAARMAGVPVVVHTFHGHLLRGYFSPAVTATVVRVERALARLTTRLVAVGEQVREDLLAARIGHREQYDVVPPGISLAPLPERATARRSLGLPLDRPVVTLVARLAVIKRADRFVDMALRVARTHPDALFVVCGEGETLAQTRAAAAFLGDRMRFVGWRADVETVYAASDVVVLTSDNEGMPVSLIEAALAGLPSVATDVGSVSEVVLHKETGFVTDLDAEHLAASVARLLDDAGLRARMGAEAQRHAWTHFSQPRLVADTERIYETALAARRAAP